MLAAEPAAELAALDVRGLRLLLPRSSVLADLDPEVERAFDAALRRFSGRGASRNGMDRRARRNRCRGAVSFRDSLSLAISSFHGDRMVVVPRRLRQSRLLCIASQSDAMLMSIG